MTEEELILKFPYLGDKELMKKLMDKEQENHEFYTKKLSENYYYCIKDYNEFGSATKEWINYFKCGEKYKITYIYSSADIPVWFSHYIDGYGILRHYKFFNCISKEYERHPYLWEYFMTEEEYIN